MMFRIGGTRSVVLGASSCRKFSVVPPQRGSAIDIECHTPIAQSGPISMQLDDLVLKAQALFPPMDSLQVLQELQRQIDQPRAHSSRKIARHYVTYDFYHSPNYTHIPQLLDQFAHVSRNEPKTEVVSRQRLLFLLLLSQRCFFPTAGTIHKESNTDRSGEETAWQSALTILRHSREALSDCAPWVARLDPTALTQHTVECMYPSMQLLHLMRVLSLASPSGRCWDAALALYSCALRSTKVSTGPLVSRTADCLAASSPAITALSSPILRRVPLEDAAPSNLSSEATDNTFNVYSKASKFMRHACLLVLLDAERWEDSLRLFHHALHRKDAPHQSTMSLLSERLMTHGRWVEAVNLFELAVRLISSSCQRPPHSQRVNHTRQTLRNEPSNSDQLVRWRPMLTSTMNRMSMVSRTETTLRMEAFLRNHLPQLQLDARAASSLGERFDSAQGDAKMYDIVATVRGLASVGNTDDALRLFVKRMRECYPSGSLPPPKDEEDTIRELRSFILASISTKHSDGAYTVGDKTRSVFDILDRSCGELEPSPKEVDIVMGKLGSSRPCYASGFTPSTTRVLADPNANWCWALRLLQRCRSRPGSNLVARSISMFLRLPMPWVTALAAFQQYRHILIAEEADAPNNVEATKASSNRQRHHRQPQIVVGVYCASLVNVAELLVWQGQDDLAAPIIRALMQKYKCSLSSYLLSNVSGTSFDALIAQCGDVMSDSILHRSATSNGSDGIATWRRALEIVAMCTMQRLRVAVKVANDRSVLGVVPFAALCAVMRRLHGQRRSAGDIYRLQGQGGMISSASSVDVGDASCTKERWLVALRWFQHLTSCEPQCLERAARSADVATNQNICLFTFEVALCCLLSPNCGGEEYSVRVLEWILVKHAMPMPVHCFSSAMFEEFLPSELFDDRRNFALEPEYSHLVRRLQCTAVLIHGLRRSLVLMTPGSRQSNAKTLAAGYYQVIKYCSKVERLIRGCLPPPAHTITHQKVLQPLSRGALDSSQDGAPMSLWGMALTALSDMYHCVGVDGIPESALRHCVEACPAAQQQQHGAGPLLPDDAEDVMRRLLEEVGRWSDVSKKESSRTTSLICPRTVDAVLNRYHWKTAINVLMKQQPRVTMVALQRVEPMAALELLESSLFE